MPDGDNIDFAGQIEAVARRLYGEPNAQQSSAAQLRFGTHGSLAVEIAGDNRGTWYDHEAEIGGGTLDLIRHKLGLINGDAVAWMRQDTAGNNTTPRFRPPPGRLRPPPQPLRPPPRRIAAYYDYESEDGELLYQALRYEPKGFSQRRPDGRGGWVSKLGDVRIVPYRLPTFAGATPSVICIPEGEKDVEALRALGYVATCNPMGAGKWREDFAEYFRGWHVVILPDNDDAGRKHAQTIARNLAPVADRVLIVELPHLPPKGDVSDWLAAGGTPEQLTELVAAAEPFDPGPTRPSRITAADIWSMQFEPLRWTVPDYLPEGLSILAGRQKLGKTWMAIDFVIAVGTGGNVFGNIGVEQGDVLFFDLENGMRRFRRRLDTLFPYEPARPDLSRIEYRQTAPQLGDDFIQECEAWRASVEKPTLIVVDVLHRIKPAGAAARNSYENDYAALSDLQQWATQHGVSVLVLHHTRKGGADDPLEALSGSNGLSACADTTLVLDRTAAGLTLYVRGRDVEEVETALRFDNGLFSILGNADEWKRSGERAAILRTLREAGEPMNAGEIAAASGMRHSNVRQLLFKMDKACEVVKQSRGRYLHPFHADNSHTPDNIDNIDNIDNNQSDGEALPGQDGPPDVIAPEVSDNIQDGQQHGAGNG